MMLLWFLGLWLLLAAVTAPLIGRLLRRARRRQKGLAPKNVADGYRQKAIVFRDPRPSEGRGARPFLSTPLEGPDSRPPLDICTALRRRGLR